MPGQANQPVAPAVAGLRVQSHAFLWFPGVIGRFVVTTRGAGRRLSSLTCRGGDAAGTAMTSVRVRQLRHDAADSPCHPSAAARRRSLTAATLVAALIYAVHNLFRAGRFYRYLGDGGGGQQSRKPSRPRTVVANCARCCSRRRPGPDTHTRRHLRLMHIGRRRTLHQTPQQSITTVARGLEELASPTGVLMATVRSCGKTHTPN